MKPEEIKSFLDTNTDLIRSFYSDEFDIIRYVDIDDLPQLLQRVFESKEYAAFVERQRWKIAKSYSIGIDVAKNIDTVWTFER